MIFNSIQYGIFLPIVVGLYWVLRQRGRLWLLFVASYAFYAFWDVRFLSLLVVSTLVDFFVAQAIHASTDERRRRWLLGLSATVNLGILGTFKYADFFIREADRALGAVGLGFLGGRSLGLILPVGVSFYHFITLAYTVDVFRRRIEPQRDLLTFTVFLSFFPLLVAGPIERASHLLPQFERERPRLTSLQWRRAGVLILQGLVKKVVIADALAPTVNAAFGAPDRASGFTLLLGVYAFAIQIYCDFSAYSDIARGSAQLLGIDVMHNFEQPYLSRHITEFWRRWHISLSTWLRDYLYVPLGGNRGSGLATARNLMITMVLGGLWHGAATTYLVWGFLHGLALGAHRPFRSRTLARRRSRALAAAPVPALVSGPPVDGTEPVGLDVDEHATPADDHRAITLADRDDSDRLRWADVVPIVVTFHFVCLAWVFFRAASVGQAFDVLAGIATWNPGRIGAGGAVLVALFAAITLALDLAQRATGDHAVVLRLPPWWRGVVYGVAVAAIVVSSGRSPVPFLYFQF